jgi:hypothetical protein
VLPVTDGRKIGELASVDEQKHARIPQTERRETPELPC